MTYKVGDKIKFRSEKQRYTIQACNDRFLICTKPFNLKKTFMYILVDLKDQIRGTEGKYCAYSYDKPEEAEKALNKLIDTANELIKDYFEQFEIDRQYSIKLDIEEIIDDSN